MRKAKVLDSLPTLLDSEAEAIASYGEHGLHALIVDTGIVCHHAALRRIVDAQTLSELGGLLGIALDTHDARIVKASESLSIARSITTKSPADVEPLAAAILHDGLHCWNCWIEHQPASLHGFFRRMTPSALRMQDMPDGVTRARSDCRHRVSLFDARRALVTERDEVPLRRKA
jgi:hypothetical protein